MWLAAGDQVRCAVQIFGPRNGFLTPPAAAQDGVLSVFSAQPLPDQLEPVTTFSLSQGMQCLLHIQNPTIFPESGSSLIRGWFLQCSTRTEPISSTLFHPTEPWLVTTSGTRHFQKKDAAAPERDWLDSDPETDSDGDDDAGSVDASSAVGDAAGRLQQPAMSSGPLTDSMGNDDARSGYVNRVKNRPADSLKIWSLI